MNKFCLYKTAYSPLHQSYVQILKVRFDSLGEPIFDTLMDQRPMMFRIHELTDFCL